MIQPVTFAARQGNGDPSLIRFAEAPLTAITTRRLPNIFRKQMGGQIIKLRNLDHIPQLLMNAIRDAGRGAIDT